MKMVGLFYCYAEPGRANSDLLNLFDELRSRHEIHFFSMSKGEDRDNLTHHVIPRLKDRPYLWPFYIPDLLALAQKIKKLNPNFIVSDSVVYVLLPVYVLSKILGIPLVVYCRELILEYPFRKKTITKPIKDLAARLLRPVRNWMIKTSPLVVAMDEGLREFFEKETGRRVYLIPASINFRFLLRNMRPELGLAPHEKLILYIGSYHRYRGLDLLIESFSRAKTSDSKLIFGGWRSEDDMAYLQDLLKAFGVADSVVFLSALPYHEVPSLVYSCDLCVEPRPKIGSQEFQIALKVLDYMAAGRPTIAINARGNRYLITDGYNGLLADYTVDDFSAKLALLLNDSDLRRKLGEYAMKVTKETYDSVKVAADFENLVRSQLDLP